MLLLAAAPLRQLLADASPPLAHLQVAIASTCSIRRTSTCWAAHVRDITCRTFKIISVVVMHACVFGTAKATLASWSRHLTASAVNARTGQGRSCFPHDSRGQSTHSLTHSSTHTFALPALALDKLRSMDHCRCGSWRLRCVHDCVQGPDVQVGPYRVNAAAVIGTALSFQSLVLTHIPPNIFFPTLGHVTSSGPACAAGWRAAWPRSLLASRVLALRMCGAYTCTSLPALARWAS